MIGTLLDVASGLVLVIGSLFALIGAIGVLRFPDALTRMHAASKAGALGSGLCLVAVALHQASFDVTTRAIAAVIFFLLTAPVSAHLIARAILLAGYPAVLVSNAMRPNSGANPPNEPARDEDERIG